MARRVRSPIFGNAIPIGRAQEFEATLPHPERTARCTYLSDWGSYLYQEWPNRQSMAKSIRMQERRERKSNDWVPVVKLSPGEGYKRQSLVQRHAAEVRDMVAIETKYLGPTNHRGSRVKAFTESGRSLVIQWDHALGSAENHTAAARALAERMDWGRGWVRAHSSRGYVFVRADSGAAF